MDVTRAELLIMDVTQAELGRDGEQKVRLSVIVTTAEQISMSVTRY